MAFLKRECFDAIRNIPIYDVVAPVVQLSRAGREWRGLSPFTNEKTPSFYVVPEKNFFKCFSSGLAGDGIKFLRETEKLEFMEAVEALAERFQIPLEYEDGGRGPSVEQRSRKRELIDLHEYVADYFHRFFLSRHEEAEKGRQYWMEGRGFSMEVAEEFKIGLAPLNPRDLLPMLSKKGFSHEVLSESRLFFPDQRSPSSLENWGHFFRGRLMIPIREIQGQIVAFTARQLDWTPQTGQSAKAKYINSMETAIFRKSQMLFNLDRAKEAARQQDRFLLVEGQLDAIRCATQGFPHAVAPQGTGIGEEQLQRLKRFTSNLDVCLDGDRAGISAIIRLLPIALKAGIDLRVFPLAPGEDPDDRIRKGGQQAFEEIASRAESALRFAVRNRYRPEDPPHTRSKVTTDFFEILSNCESTVVQSAYLEEFVDATGLPRIAVERDFEGFQKEKERRERFRASSGGDPRSPKEKSDKSRNKLTQAVTDLLWIALQNARWAHLLSKNIDLDWLRENPALGHRLLYRLLADAAADLWEGMSGASFWAQSEEELDLMFKLYTEERPDFDEEAAAGEAILYLAKQACEVQLEELLRKEKNLFESGEAIQFQETAARKRELREFILKGEPPHLSFEGTE